jgi:hypothetical protein
MHPNKIYQKQRNPKANRNIYIAFYNILHSLDIMSNSLLSEIIKALHPKSISLGRLWKVQEASGITGKGLHEGLNWLILMRDLWKKR